MQEYLSPRVAAAADKGQASREWVGSPAGGWASSVSSMQGLVLWAPPGWLGPGCRPCSCHRLCSDHPTAASSGVERGSGPALHILLTCPAPACCPVQEAEEAALAAELRMPVSALRSHLQRQAQAKERSEAEVGGCMAGAQWGRRCAG